MKKEFCARQTTRYLKGMLVDKINDKFVHSKAWRDAAEQELAIRKKGES